MNYFSILDSEMKNILGDPPEMIYHYTGANGLIGILNDSSFWATKSDYLNDPIEEEYGRNIIHEVFSEEADNIDNKDISKLFRAIAQNIKNKDLQCESNYYISSFSENPNDLVQWKMYGSNGWGYSIGVRVGDKGISKEHILPVIYEPNKQYQATKKFAEIVRQYFEGADVTPNTLNDAYFHITPALKVLLICMKQPEYQHEREWRLVFNPNRKKLSDEIIFRVGNNETIIPYVKLPVTDGKDNLETIPIGKIILGPQRNTDHESLKLLISCSKQNKGICIENSNIKYRL